jgi:adenylyltransferase/sulfurtransferase
MQLTSVFTSVELDQYSRHFKLQGFGLEKQTQLKAARVLLVGAGGLGCPVGLYLAAAGVGTIGVVDFDRVDRSNLQRQIAHSVDTIGQLKVDSLVQAMQAINPLLKYQKHPVRLGTENVLDLIRQYDLVLDGSDNFATRFLLADACFLGRIPLLQGSVYEYEAQLTLFLPGEGPCYRCIFPEPPGAEALSPCAEVGVLGVVPGTVGLMMATEALKYLTGLGTSIDGKLLIYNALEQTLKKLSLSRNEQCALCGDNPGILSPVEALSFCDFPADPAAFSIEAEAAKLLLSQGVQLLDVREAFEFQSGHIPQAIHLPLAQLRVEIPAGIFNREQPILVYCQKGQRSLEAARILKASGHNTVYSLAGGMASWNGPVRLPV